VEHASVLAAAAALERRGAAVTRVDPDPRGVVPAGAVLDGAAGGRVLVSVMLANNETGVLQPVRAIARGRDPARVRVHTDAVQAAGKIPVDVADLGVDLLSLSSHKIAGPKGAGALWARDGAFPLPLLHGGGQEQGVRAGTENVGAIVGFGRAAELARTRLAACAETTGRLRDRLESLVRGRVPGAVAVGAGAPRVPNTCCLAFPGVEGTALVELLDLKGVAASTGSACEAGSSEVSHVLRAMGLPATLLRGAVRFSLGPETTEDEILEAAERIVAAVEDLGAL
jgi:cysteine desulfurase